MRPFLLIACCAFSLAPRGAWAQQTVFRCTDGTGRVAYQAEPCGQRMKQNEVRLPAPPEPSAPRESMWKGYTAPKQAVITLYYDAAEQPVGFSTEQMESMLQAAMAAWMSGCKVRLQYGGRAARSTAAGADRVIVRWAPEYMRMAHPADARSGVAGTGSLTDGIALKPRFHEKDMLGVLVHEMGHVLGLPHNHADTGSVMSYLRDDQVRANPQPSASDFLACNLSMKRMFGIDYTPPAQAASGAAPRMTDREALERLHGAPR